jgi:hypothetical protein
VDLVDLQRAAGNAAVTAVLQRSPLAMPEAPQVKRPLLQRGSAGKQVRILQQRLNALGASPALKVDGKFGKKTREAVIAFQQQHFPDDEHEWDGKVGKRTWAAIDAAYETPEIGADQASLGQQVVKGMDRVNAGGKDAESGVWYSHNYQAHHPDRYTDDMRSGYADPTYFEKTAPYAWTLKPKMSASAAIRSWLDGLTIAECFTAMIAIEYETVRAAVGNAAFDREFGSADVETPVGQRMVIDQSKTSPIRRKFMRRTEAAEQKDYGTPGNRPARVGDWYYFMNHPRYLLKHPDGAWQGENAIYVGLEGGVQKWAGMGTLGSDGGSSHVTEAELLDSMVQAYNAERTAGDLTRLAEITVNHGGVLPPRLLPGAYPEKLGSPADILNAPAEKIEIEGFVMDEVERKGGFRPDAGKALDQARVQQLREGLPVP